MSLDHYLQHRRGYEVLGWAVFLIANLVANVTVVQIDLARLATGHAAWEPVVWEASSTLALAALLPFLLWVDARAPLDDPRWRRHALWQLLATLPYSWLHVGLMVAMREAVYRAVGGHYDFGDWGSQWLYEYLKDLRTWFGFVAIVYLYRFGLRRLRGEARMLAEGEAEDAAPAVDRFLVKKLGREFLVRVEDILWVESAGNYVTLHCPDGHYLLRDTMARIAERLEPQGFARVHRGAILNLDRVREIRPFDTGDAEAVLHNGARVAISRRYRKGLKQRLS